MNKRIKELAEKCKYNNPNGWVDCPDPSFLKQQFDQEKFAELIIQNCISQIAMLGVSNCKDPDVVWTVKKSIQLIREYFEIGDK